MSDSDDSSEQVIPAGVLRKRKGWAGDELEMSRTLAMKKKDDEDGEAEKPLTLKDGFQNKEVGQGYQHRGVMRQKDSRAGVGKILDMRGGGRGGGEEPKKKKKQRGEGGGGDVRGRILASREMREFKKNIKQMLR